MARPTLQIGHSFAQIVNRARHFDERVTLSQEQREHHIADQDADVTFHSLPGRQGLQRHRALQDSAVEFSTDPVLKR